MLEVVSFLLESCPATLYNAFSLLLYSSPKYFALLLALEFDRCCKLGPTLPFKIQVKLALQSYYHELCPLSFENQ
jgi:uncharacterized membrane protein YpjA